MPLTDRQVKAAKPQEKKYKLADGKGLYLEVRANGSKYWRMKYRFQGKEKLAAFGVYPDVSLAAAREQRDAARTQLTQGIDPNATKRAKKQAGREAAENSFELIAREWFSIQMTDMSEGHQKRTIRALEKHLFGSIGKRPISEITALDLLPVLRKIEDKGHVETAHRVKQVAGQVFRYGIVTGRCDRNPCTDLKDALRPAKKSHFAAITNPKELGRLLVSIDEYPGTPAVIAALKCSALWFCRPGELRQVRWDQINWEEKRIEITAEKTHQPHIIPLARQSLEILESLKPITGRSQYVFPSARGASRPMSDGAVRIALRGMGYDRETHTAHGFRATARTLLDEVLDYRIEWIEQQLAHEVKDANGRSYNRTRHLEQRRKMMQHWADYLDQLKAAANSSNVINGNFGG
ncbi:tyrosine-type recombinase/integrase [Marinobacterium litorale]|uniref:tyrosine-type recombinase/integrase n=1 Tax=Marinobacterium litorale TaxID=404770 RepID=UPI00040771BB|nr:integrase arm-type DNA-binding domain-containing protein [Marinobacterium litorale]